MILGIKTPLVLFFSETIIDSALLVQFVVYYSIQLIQPEETLKVERY